MASSEKFGRYKAKRNLTEPMMAATKMWRRSPL